MAKHVLIAGSLHLDTIVDAPRLPQLEETLAGTAVRAICGGKGGNQAVASARAGTITHFAGRIGDDAAGKVLKDNLVESGVEVSLLQTGAGEASGMSVAIVNPQGDYGAVIVSAANLAIDPEKIRIQAGTACVVLQNEIAENTNLAIAMRARLAGCTVILNAAPARPINEALYASVDILIVNRIEAEMLSGIPVSDRASAIRAASQLATMVGKVVVTLGGEGLVHIAAGQRAEYQPAFRTPVISTHGAGDFFVGAFASQMADGSEFEAAIHYAQAAAAVYVGTAVEKRAGIRATQIRARLGEDEL